jgi:tetratricopeptide (TPR) repeat protein
LCWRGVVLVLISTIAFSQTTIKEFEQFIIDEDWTKIKDQLPAMEQAYPDHPSVLYAKGVMTRDANEAMTCFHQILQTDPASPFSDEALLRIGQYNYAKNRYDLARKYFSLLARSYQQSPLRDDAQYLMCQSILAQGKADSARIFFEAFIKNAPQSPFVDSAVLDLERISASLKPDTDGDKNSIQAPKPKKSYYTIQVGAFVEKKNAENMATSLRKLSYPIEVYEKFKERKKIYVVLIGQFGSYDAANTAANKNIKNYVEEYRIVERIPIK